MSKTFLWRFIGFVSLLFVLFAGTVWANGNIDSINNTARLQIDSSDVLFVCPGCEVLVTDDSVEGTFWGESLGWVNLQPAGGGVVNTQAGEVAGNAWGSISGWIDFEDVSIDTSNGYFSGVAVSQNRGGIQFSCPGPFCVQTSWRPEGCTDPNASNYNPLATVDDNSCTYLVLGCTDPEANNFNPDAQQDDNSCTYTILGCIDPEAENFNPGANTDDSSCQYPTPDPQDDPEDSGGGGGGGGSTDTLGCTNPNAINFNSSATADNGSCLFEITGCTDSSANNYNPFATENDTSCVYGVDVFGCMDPSSILYNPSATITSDTACIIDAHGCMDPNATNFNPTATIPSGVCEYQQDPPEPLPEDPIFGCMIPQAVNYNSNANTSDGSCILISDPDIEGCTVPNAVNYNPSAGVNDGSCLFTVPNVQDEEGQDQQDNQDGGLGQDTDSNFFDDVTNTVGDIVTSITSTIGDVISSIFSNNPTSSSGSDSGIFSFDKTFLITDSPFVASLLSTLVLAASLLQIFPIREMNLLLTMFGFHALKKHWGTVYDSVTKQPLDPAYVTIYDDQGQAVDTVITDIDGRYYFMAGTGTYYLRAEKTDYVFPSKRLEGKKYDELYNHLYFGERFEVKDTEDIVSKNIPMDPLQDNWNEIEKRKTKVTHFYRPHQRFFGVLSHVLFALGFAFSIWVFFTFPNIINGIVLTFYIVGSILQILGVRKIPRGTVSDSQGNILPYAIVRAYSAETGVEVRHGVVSQAGHYLLLVPKGTYTLVVERKLPNGSYEKIYESLAFRSRRGVIAKNIHIDVEPNEREVFDQSFGVGGVA